MKTIEQINNNEVVGFPTDTVFGLVAKLNKDNISKINNLKGRDSDQPLQILFESLDKAKEVIKDDGFVLDYLIKNYESNTSYIVNAKEEFINKFLTKGFNGTLMFRIPTGEINELIKVTGPLFATSANKHGEEPLNSSKQVKNEFNINVFDGKQTKGKPSKIISLLNKEKKIIRK